jgi:hypothetical protein
MKKQRWEESEKRRAKVAKRQTSREPLRFSHVLGHQKLEK